MKQISLGTIVKTRYNSGEYIGEVIEDRGNFLLVEIQAVLKHPDQGDLHHPGQADGVAFHERKALAYREKCNARKRHTERFNHTVPTYEISLKEAISEIKESLRKESSAYSIRSLQKIADLEKYYYHKLI